MATSMNMQRITLVEQRQQDVDRQREWIAECGGDEQGYVARYGSKTNAKHSGDGGEAIYAADRIELARRLTALSGAMIAPTSTADHDHQPSLIGICHVWIKNVRILGYGARPNEYIRPGTIGDMEVIETSVDGRVINARFHPKGSNGFGLVVWPKWEHCPEDR